MLEAFIDFEWKKKTVDIFYFFPIAIVLDWDPFSWEGSRSHLHFAFLYDNLYSRKSFQIQQPKELLKFVGRWIWFLSYLVDPHKYLINYNTLTGTYYSSQKIRDKNLSSRSSEFRSRLALFLERNAPSVTVFYNIPEHCNPKSYDHFVMELVVEIIRMER